MNRTINSCSTRSYLTNGIAKRYEFLRALKTAGIIRCVIAAGLCTLVTACGTKYADRSPDAPPATTNAPLANAPEPTVATPAPITVSPEIRPTSVPDASQPRSLPAAIALRKQAATAADNGNHSRAIGLLERAIRISPADPATFSALAENHLAQNRPQQALELTRRALTLNPTTDQRTILEAPQQRCLALL